MSVARSIQLADLGQELGAGLAEVRLGLLQALQRDRIALVLLGRAQLVEVDAAGSLAALAQFVLLLFSLRVSRHCGKRDAAGRNREGRGKSNTRCEQRCLRRSLLIPRATCSMHIVARRGLSRRRPTFLPGTVARRHQCRSGCPCRFGAPYYSV